MRTLIRLALPLVLLTAACGRTPQLDTRTFSLQYLSADAVHGLIEPYVYTDRADAPGSLSFTESTVTVRETADNLDKIARVLAQYDVPSPWVRLHFQLIEADGAATQDPRIAAVEAELKKLFRYQGYRLISEAMVSGAGRSRVEQSIGGRDSSDTQYLLAVEIGQIRTIGDSGFVPLEVHLQSRSREALSTRINARAGQTVVLGNTQLDRAGNARILTVRAELVSQ
jgi:hypothetical protein